MACACEKDGSKKCAWCKEAEKIGRPPAKHNCSHFGSCS
jgi:hypothetical protein